MTAASPVELYGEGLLLAAGEPRPATPASWLRYADGRVAALDIPTWSGPPAGADEALLGRCTGPVLDLGCGPGRLTRALVRRGVECLGVDVAPVAVALARTGGTPVLHASVYDEVLDGTQWATVLLADGNIGIGGDPVALLARARALSPQGLVLVELDPPQVPSRRVRVRIETVGGRVSSWFPWAHVSVRDATTLAGKAGLAVDELWTSAGRHFAHLVPCEQAWESLHAGRAT